MCRNSTYVTRNIHQNRRANSERSGYIAGVTFGVISGGIIMKLVQTQKQTKDNRVIDIIEEFTSSVVCVESHLSTNRQFQGSGFIVDGSGLILTNAHVLFDRNIATMPSRVQVYHMNKFD